MKTITSASLEISLELELWSLFFPSGFPSGYSGEGEGRRGVGKTTTPRASRVRRASEIWMWVSKQLPTRQPGNRRSGRKNLILLALWEDVCLPSSTPPLPSFSRLISPPSAYFPSDIPPSVEARSQGSEAEGSVLATFCLVWPLSTSLLFVYIGRRGKNQRVLLPSLLQYPYSLQTLWGKRI